MTAKIRRSITALALLCSMACAHPGLPQGPGKFARDGARAIQDIANACVDPRLGRPTGRSLRPQWRLDYQAYQDRSQQMLRLVSEDLHVDLTFRIVNPDPRPSLPGRMFSIDVPPNARE